MLDVGLEPDVENTGFYAVFMLVVGMKLEELCWNVVSHQLNTKEALPKFSRKLTLNHIGESLGSRVASLGSLK